MKEDVKKERKKERQKKAVALVSFATYYFCV